MACEHKRTLQISAKADDRQYHRVKHLGIDKDGYAPRIEGLCHGDYIDMTVCLDCGVVTSLALELVADDSDLYDAFEIEPPGGEDNALLDELGR